jgi:hypothetical protein
MSPARSQVSPSLPISAQLFDISDVFQKEALMGFFFVSAFIFLFLARILFFICFFLKDML